VAQLPLKTLAAPVANAPTFVKTRTDPEVLVIGKDWNDQINGWGFVVSLPQQNRAF
jgi:hypothetical protein